MQVRFKAMQGHRRQSMHDENVELGVGATSPEAVVVVAGAAGATAPEAIVVVAGAVGTSPLTCVKGHRRHVLHDEPMTSQLRWGVHWFHNTKKTELIV